MKSPYEQNISKIVKIFFFENFIPCSLSFLTYSVFTTSYLISLGLTYNLSSFSYFLLSLCIYLIISLLFCFFLTVILAICNRIRNKFKFKSSTGKSLWFLCSSFLFFPYLSFAVKFFQDPPAVVKVVPFHKIILFAIISLLYLILLEIGRIILIRFNPISFLLIPAVSLLLIFIMVISLFYHLGYPGSFNISEENGIDRRILLISIDTLRQDFVGTYGNQKINTPNIDGLADDSIVYLDAVSQAPYTWPSLSSLLTGRFTFRHGVRMNGQKLKDSELSLSEILFMHGFETSFLTDIGVGGLGLEQGFKHNLEKEKGLTEFEPFRRILTFIPGFSWWFQGGPDSSLPMTLEALRWLRKNAKKNSWFLWIHYYNDSPHEPYTSPEPYKSMYVDPEYHGSMTGNLEELVSLTMNRSSVSEADRNQLIALYMGEITWMDYQVGLILKLLKQTDLYSKTNIILTSDHGQMFGRMGNYQHSYYLYDSLLRVPLIIKPDENFTKTHHLDPEKKRISGLVRLLDLHPTILELAGINSDNNSKIDGQSLLPLAGNNSVPASSRLNYSETLKYGIHNPKNTGSDLELCLGFSMISSDGWKLIHVMDQNQDYLYNRISDPGESLNVSVQNPEKVKDLTQKILTLLNIQNLDSLTPKEIELPDETLKESLRALGYVH